MAEVEELRPSQAQIEKGGLSPWFTGLHQRFGAAFEACKDFLNGIRTEFREMEDTLQQGADTDVGLTQTLKNFKGIAARIEKFGYLEFKKTLRSTKAAVLAAKGPAIESTARFESSKGQTTWKSSYERCVLSV